VRVGGGAVVRVGVGGGVSVGGCLGAEGRQAVRRRRKRRERERRGIDIFVITSLWYTYKLTFL
jgi:hypothetical protein